MFELRLNGRSRFLPSGSFYVMAANGDKFARLVGWDVRVTGPLAARHICWRTKAADTIQYHAAERVMVCFEGEKKKYNFKQSSTGCYLCLGSKLRNLAHLFCQVQKWLLQASCLWEQQEENKYIWRLSIHLTETPLLDSRILKSGY